MNGLKKKRIEAGLSLERLGKILGVTESSIHCYETGKRAPSLKVILKMLDCFKCDIRELL